MHRWLGPAMLAVVAMAWAAPLFAAAPGEAVAPRAAIEPARQAVANEVVAKLLPPGSYRTMMNGTLDQVLKMTRDGMYDLPLQGLAGSAGLTAEQKQKLGTGTIREVMALLDPAFEQRQTLMTKVMMTEMVNLMDGFEPDLRAGMAEAYARRLSLADLEALRAFLATPAGTAFASQMMLIGTDPAFMERMQAFIPRMTAALPAILAKASAATAGLPPARRFEDLDAKDKAALQKLVGGSR